MTQQDTDKKDLLTIDQLAKHAMAEADKETADSQGGEATDGDNADDTLTAAPDDANGKKSRKRKVKTEDDESKTEDEEDNTEDEEDKTEDEEDKTENEEDKTEDEDRKTQKADKDSLKERLRQYVDDDDAPPPSFKISLKAILGGDGLSKIVARNWLFILVIVFFTCCYVTSRYLMQGATIEHTNLNKQLEDRKIKALTVTSEYLEKTRKEYIKESLTDTTLHSTVEIPYSLPLN